jgi:hypothetical protein
MKYGAGGVRGRRLIRESDYIYVYIGLYIRIYMYEQDGVGWAEIREVL